MANVKITALNHISAAQLAPEDVFVIDDVSQLITYKVTLSNVTRYVNTGVIANLDSYAAYANANAAALANAISSVSTNFTISDGSASDTVLVGVETFSFIGDTGVETSIGDNELRISISNTGVTSGSYGGANGSNYYIPSLTIDAQGRISDAQNVSVAIDFSSVTANINTVSSNVDGVETRRSDNTFYSYNTHSVATSANIVPATSNSLTLGSDSFAWSELHLGSAKLSADQPNSIRVTTSTDTFLLDSNTAIAYSNVLQLESNVNNIYSSIGNLDDLATVAKTNLVSAINEVASNANFQSMSIGTFTVEESITSNVSTIGATVFIMDKASSNFAKLIVNVTDLTYGQYQSSEILLVHDNNSVRIVEYAINYTSTNPIVTFDASIESNNIVLNATALSADNLIRVLKFIN